MALISDVAAGLAILAEYPKAGVWAEHDVIYADGEGITEEASAKLVDLSWTWDGDLECWRTFVRRQAAHLPGRQAVLTLEDGKPVTVMNLDDCHRHLWRSCVCTTICWYDRIAACACCEKPAGMGKPPYCAECHENGCPGQQPQWEYAVAHVEQGEIVEITGCATQAEGETVIATCGEGDDGESCLIVRRDTHWRPMPASQSRGVSR